MRPEQISRQLGYEPWQADAKPVRDTRSAHAMRIIELANTLAAAETAVLLGDKAKAVADLKRLQADTLEMLAQLERPYAAAV
jgi:hypothetical protein